MFRVHPIANTGFSRTYIVEGDSALMAVDVGSRGAADDTIEYIETRLKKNIEDLHYITATHFHIDHIGGMGHLIKKCQPEATVLFNWRVREYLTGKKKISLIRNWCSGLAPATVVSARYVRRFSHLAFVNLAGIPLPGLRNIANLPIDSERIRYFGSEGSVRYPLGFDGWEVMETPGHTEDSVSFYNRHTRELICGDLIVNISKGGRGTLNRFHWRGEIIKQSFRHLCNTVSPCVVYPGHGEVIRNRGNALVRVKTF